MMVFACQVLRLLFAFDLLELSGEDLRRLAKLLRKRPRITRECDALARSACELVHMAGVAYAL
jgi:hypothetical protein